MSVQYYLNKNVTMGDLKMMGLTIEDHQNEPNSHPFVVINEYDSGVAISKLDKHDSENVDNWEIIEFEGRNSRGGGGIMLEICDKLNRLFITDEDIDNLFYENRTELTEETYKQRTDEFKKFMTEE